MNSSKKFNRQVRKLGILVSLLFGSLILFLRFQKHQATTPKTSPSLAASPYRNLTKYIEAQAQHETGNYTSSVFKRLNNLFGMKVPIIRTYKGKPSNIIAEGRPYLSFKNSEESIQDFLLYLDYVNFPTEVDDVYHYVNELKQREYFQDSYINYVTGVRKWMD